MKKGLIAIIIILLFVGCGVLGYLAYTLNEDSTKYQNEIKDYKAQIQKLDKTVTTNKKESEDETTSTCTQIVKNNSYVVENSGNDGSNGGQVIEKTSMTFGNDSKVHQVSGTAAWEDNYSISGNVITFDNSGTKSYAVLSQDCKIIYTIDTTGVKIYQKK